MTHVSTDHDWTAPGADEIASGVYRIPLPLLGDALRAVNVYVLREIDGGLTLIDSGWAIPGARELLAEMLGRIGHSLADIRRFLVTHLHRDHYTLGVALRREFGCEVLLGAGEERSIRQLLSPTHRPRHRDAARMRQLGADSLAVAILAQPPGELEEQVKAFELPDAWMAADTISVGARAVEVVPTPGHTHGHVVFRDAAAGLLFSGDHVLPAITPSIGFEAVGVDNPLGDFLASLAALRAMPDTRLLPAHGPVTNSVHDRVDQLVSHHDRRLDQTEAAVRAGAETVFEVAQQLRWTRREQAFAELDVFNQILAVDESAAHVNLLVAQGRLSTAELTGYLNAAPDAEQRHDHEEVGGK